MTWNPWTTPLDTARISGIDTPGLLRIRNADSPRAWDERNGYGWSGSFPVFMGIRLSHFEMGFELYDDDDWADYQKILPLLAKPPLGKRPKALSISHPILQQLEIGSIQITNVKQLEIDDNGIVTQPIEVISFRVPKLALSKPEGSQTQNDDDPYDKKIRALTDRNANDFKELSDLMGKP
jgi:hypothetical protein